MYQALEQASASGSVGTKALIASIHSPLIRGPQSPLSFKFELVPALADRKALLMSSATFAKYDGFAFGFDVVTQQDLDGNRHTMTLSDYIVTVTVPVATASGTGFKDMRKDTLCAQLSYASRGHRDRLERVKTDATLTSIASNPSKPSASSGLGQK